MEKISNGQGNIEDIDYQTASETTNQITNQSCPNSMFGLYRIIPLLPREKWKLFSIPILIASVIVFPAFKTSDRESFQYRFPEQPGMLWEAVISGVHDVANNQRPSSFIILYKSQSEEIVDEILTAVSEYISRVLQTSDGPIILNSEELNLPPFSQDYGEIIAKYKIELESKAVLIVKNIENLSGNSAQAFHVICDEYTPLVPRAVIIFTVKVDEFPENDYLYLRNLFQDRWKDLDDDIFEPLFTRISSMVLRINPTQQKMLPAVHYYYDMFINNIYIIFLWLILVLSIIFLGSKILDSYKDILQITDQYPEYRKQIWQVLYNINCSDHLFLIGVSEDLVLNIRNYLKNSLHLEEVKISKQDLKHINKFLERNKGIFESKTLLLIENFESLQEKLLELYLNNKELQSLVRKSKKCLVVNIVGSSFSLDEDLDEEYLRLIPSRKVLQV